MVVLFLTFSLPATVVGFWPTHLVFPALEDVAPYVSMTRRCFEGRSCGTSVFLGST
jgi:hypothetical protein